MKPSATVFLRGSIRITVCVVTSSPGSTHANWARAAGQDCVTEWEGQRGGGKRREGKDREFKAIGEWRKMEREREREGKEHIGGVTVFKHLRAESALSFINTPRLSSAPSPLIITHRFISLNHFIMAEQRTRPEESCPGMWLDTLC